MLTSSGNIMVDERNREHLRHRTSAFPYACYHPDLPRDEIRWHWHDELEAAIVSEGSLHAAFGGESFVLNEGDGYFVNTGVLHRCRALTKERCRMHSMGFLPRLIGGIDSVFYQSYVLPITGNADFAGMCLHRSVPWQAEALDLLERAWRACAEEPPRYDIEVRYALSRALAEISEHISGLRIGISAKGLRDGERIKTMLQFIMDNYGEAIDTAAIARSAAVSESECLRCFKSTIGATPIRYLREYRVERAANLLAGGGAAIVDVAARCGFQDVSYFTKTFRELKGATPKAYQRERQRDELKSTPRQKE